MPRTITVNNASITLLDDEVNAALEKISSGAVHVFLDTVTPALQEIKEEAEASWPVRTGLSAGSFKIVEQVDESGVSSTLLNDARNRWGAYAYKIRWSVRTAASLQQEAQQAASRGTTPQAQAAILQHWTRRLQAVHGQGAPNPAEAGKQPWILYVRKPADNMTASLLPQLQSALDALAQRAI